MPVMRAGEIAAAVGGELVNVSPDHRFRDYHFDSREVGESCLFFALTSERADGHAFLARVAERPGSGAVVRRSFDGPLPAIPLIRVEDPRAAYTDLARHVRRRCSQVRYVGITGSAGKTTTREFTGRILSRRFRVHQPPGNWNNWQGVPFALLKMPDDAEAAVFELAMSWPGLGEVDHLASIVVPHIAVVLNVLPVHLEFLGTVDNVARGKLEIFNHLAPNGVALLNGDFDQLLAVGRAMGGRTILFGRDPGRNQVVLKEVVASAGSTRLVVVLDGREEPFVAPRLTGAQVDNLFAAILIAWQAGLELSEIRDAVAELEPVRGRGVISEHRGVTVVDDTYNANPEAVKKLLHWAAGGFPRPRVAVLGDMLELGDDELRFHAEVGEVVAALGFDLLVTVGRRARALADGARGAGLPAEAVVSFDTPEDAGAWLAGQVHRGATVLFKASRGIALERAIAAFKGERPATPAGH